MNDSLAMISYFRETVQKDISKYSKVHPVHAVCFFLHLTCQFICAVRGIFYNFVISFSCLFNDDMNVIASNF
jgi:hypothetical protein